MGRRNEANRLADKKKVDQKRKKKMDAELNRQLKLKALIQLKKEKGTND